MFPLHDSLDELVRSALSSYDDLTAALLARRGVVTKEDAEKFLNPSYDLHLHDPLLMTDMAKGARRLADAILSGERIAVWSDYDCDGIPGAVLLHDFLKKTGANFENYIPHRHLEGYGVSTPGIEKLAASGVKLVVTVDSGITDLEAIKRAKGLGVDVIVTDHHLPKETLPEAFAVINPNARPVRDKTLSMSGLPEASISNGTSADEPYPFLDLCGSGVAWKLVCATLATEPSLREKVPVGWEKWLLDMVGLATIADMVALTGENRLLATYGLLVMRKSPRLGLQKLCKVIRTNQRTITEDDVGFMIAPRVNAASRMGDAIDAFKLFTTESEDEAEELAKKLDGANRKRKAEAGAITRAVHDRLKEREMRSVIALGDPDWRPALLGLVANTIADEHDRPVFLWGKEGNNSIKGSVRSGGNVHALELMEAAVDTFAQFGGHAAAGGFTVEEHAVFDLEDRLVTAHAKIMDDSAFIDTLALHADAVLTPEEVSLKYLAQIEKLAPYGMQNPKPIFLLREVSIKEVAQFGKGKEHLKLTIDSSGREVNAIVFFAKGALAKTINALAPNAQVNLLAHLERDSFSRTNPVRLRLLNLKKV